MAKAQKNIKFPPEVFDWFNEVENDTGMSHSRIALAAIIAYMCADKPAYWTQLAVKVDKGEIDFRDVPRLVLEHAIRIDEQALAALTKRRDPAAAELRRLAQEQLDASKAKLASLVARVSTRAPG